MIVKMQMSLGLKGIFSLFPTGALAGLITWLVYVIRYADKGPAPDGNGATNVEKSTIAFQTVVATVLLYFVLHHHANLIMN
jgi:hypothetical protein